MWNGRYLLGKIFKIYKSFLGIKAEKHRIVIRIKFKKKRKKKVKSELRKNYNIVVCFLSIILLNLIVSSRTNFLFKREFILLLEHFYFPRRCYKKIVGSPDRFWFTRRIHESSVSIKVLTTYLFYVE